MQPIPSTAQILAYKVLNRSVDVDWVNWAVDMLMAGFDTENLTILAGISPFYNQFELQALTDKVFDELQLDYADAEKVMNNYVSFLAVECLAGRREYFPVIRILKNIHIELNYETDLHDFYMLYYAKEDLLISENQWYWPGANRSNIDAIMMDHLANWLVEHPLPTA